MPETAAKYIFVFKFVFIFVLIHLCLTPGVLIRTYSYYFLTQFSSFLFVRVKYYVELSSGRTIFVLLTMSNWRKKRFYAFDPPTKKNGHEFQSFYIRPHYGVDSGQWDWGISLHLRLRLGHISATDHLATCRVYHKQTRSQEVCTYVATRFFDLSASFVHFFPFHKIANTPSALLLAYVVWKQTPKNVKYY